jgi:diguanylate cyclase (GGDEF)-like protein
MAIAATPITRGRNIYDLLRQIVPPQEKVVDLYRRLLAINELSGCMNAAGDVDSVIHSLAAYFLEHHPEDSVRLCILDGARYRRINLSGPEASSGETLTPINDGIAGSVMKSRAPLWIPDAHSTRKLGKSCGTAADKSAHSILALPFSAMKRVVGCLEMISDQPNRFDKIEYHLGLLVAAHLSSAMENILTRQELATANAQLRDHDLHLTQLNEKLKQLAHTDEATGLFNKRRLFERLDMEVARARRYGEILSCLMIDVDDFKHINDTYGHQAGDQVLRQIGDLLHRLLRVTDFKARYGGEEFTVLLPRTNSAGAFRVSENLRSAFMAHDFVLPTATTRLTVSIGVACCSTFDTLDAQQVIQLADSALYRAKRSGKNKVCFADENELTGAKSQEFVNAVSQV